MALLQPYWSSLVEAWNNVWPNVAPVAFASADYRDRAFFAVGGTIATTGAFYLLNAMLYVVYRYDLFAQYKITPNMWPDRALVRRTLFKLVPGQVLLRPVVWWFLYPIFRRYGMPLADAPLPSATTILLHFVICVIANDTLFYWAHRTLHHRFFYKRIHKQHHEYKTSIGIAAEYAHPLEEAISNGFPTIAGCMFFGAHPCVLFLWLLLRMYETVDSHSGYEFPWSPFHLFPSIQGGAARHDYHHAHNVGNFGAFFIFWDWICVTDKTYLAWVKKKSA